MAPLLIPTTDRHISPTLRLTRGQIVEIMASVFSRGMPWANVPPFFSRILDNSPFRQMPWLESACDFAADAIRFDVFSVKV